MLYELILYRIRILDYTILDYIVILKFDSPKLKISNKKFLNTIKHIFENIEVYRNNLN